MESYLWMFNVIELLLKRIFELTSTEIRFLLQFTDIRKTKKTFSEKSTFADLSEMKEKEETLEIFENEKFRFSSGILSTMVVYSIQWTIHQCLVSIGAVSKVKDISDFR
uniref:NR LBD domain-containing protein n=1 Tax=Caenorhabditis tropicalis TaxID=1561998 RepID=A0A1I7U6Y0_9PELO